MTPQPAMKKTTRSIENKRSYTAVIIILIIGAIVLFLLKNFTDDNKKDIVFNSLQGQSIDGKSTARLPGQPNDVPAADSAPPPLPDALGSSTFTAAPEAKATLPETSCMEATKEIEDFLAYLQTQDYIKAYALNEPLTAYMSSIFAKVLANPPVNDQETADLLTVIKNASHFYRILGSKDLSLVRDIMEREQSSLEQQFANVFAISQGIEDCRANSALNVELPLAKSYEYAAFFLNTLGGQSYLARRTSLVRTLIKYYSVLVIHQAVQQATNQHNINLSYHLNAITQEINSTDLLEKQAQYLDTLQKIQNTIKKPAKVHPLTAS